MIIFFDWDNKGHSGPQDGQSDHVGIVWKVEDGIIYTVEGNSGDSCRVNQCPVGYYEILGYQTASFALVADDDWTFGIALHHQ